MIVTIDQIKTWIEKEIERRCLAKELSHNFIFRTCLIKFPPNREPIILLNNEFGWLVENPELVQGRSLADMNFGEPVTISEIVSLGQLLPPTFDGKRVAFVYIYKFEEGDEPFCFVDFLPNQEDYNPESEKFKFDGVEIRHHLMDLMARRIVKWAELNQPKLIQIGMWTCTSLMLYPLSRIVEYISEGKTEEASQLLRQFANPEFLSNLVTTWKPITAFSNRYMYFEEALANHRLQMYRSSIGVLVDEVEGVISDWLYEVKNFSSRSPKAKMEEFGMVLSEISDLSWIYQTALDSVALFLASPPWMQQFNRWGDTIDTSFPGRHPVQHGRSDKEIYTEENSIKLFLLLDTICQFMMFYEVRVLKRDLGQNEGNSDT